MLSISSRNRVYTTEREMNWGWGMYMATSKRKKKIQAELGSMQETQNTSNSSSILGKMSLGLH